MNDRIQSAVWILYFGYLKVYWKFRVIWMEAKSSINTFTHVSGLWCKIGEIGKSMLFFSTYPKTWNQKCCLFLKLYTIYGPKMVEILNLIFHQNIACQTTVWYLVPVMRNYYKNEYITMYYLTHEDVLTWMSFILSCNPSTRPRPWPKARAGILHSAMQLDYHLSSLQIK